MARPRDRLYLEQQTYQRRRLGDAAKLLPLLGFLLLLLPVLLKTTNDALIYIFSVWAILIVAINLISRRLALPSEPTEPRDAQDDT
ncbi:MAG: hypothetical protein ACU0GG_19265 [Paracoccaceae bacterium]